MRILVRLLVALSLVGGAFLAPPRAGLAEGAVRTDATYYNNAALPAADPYVLHDDSGYYYAYSTDGADPGWYFAVYRSADLVTWEKLPGGALPVDDPKQWGNDWFWAPEVYHNSATGLYFLFYAARSDANARTWFEYSTFEEPCKIGVAVSRSPAGPFRNIADRPIDYNPYDPDYHDVNLIMGPDQKRPPATLQEGLTAPLGTYIPTIDPDVFFDDTGAMYLYYSRNAYRNWVWDYDLNKYIEESNILAVPLTSKWWNDPTGRTMPSIAPAYRGANDSPGGPDGPRRDGWVRILDYDHDKQAWENADVNDYALTNGQNKDRRWEEGSTTWKSYAGGRTVYYLTYSANNWEKPQYGVGYAVANGPLGPWRKYAGNPILSSNADIGMYSTGHGSLAFSPDGTEAYYVHHGRPTPTEPQRRLYTERMLTSTTERDQYGNPVVSIRQSTSDEPVPSGVAPYSIAAAPASVTLAPGASSPVTWRVASASGALLALGNPLNRVAVAVGDPAVATFEPTGATGGTLTAVSAGHTTVTLTYQRQLSTGGYRTVDDIGPDGTRPVSVTINVTVAAP
jgi:Glycosyl hydrolases family 43